MHNFIFEIAKLYRMIYHSNDISKYGGFCLFVCLRSEAVNSSGILSIQMFPKELTEWILRIALIYTFMRVTLMQITLVLPPMRITFVRSAAQKARLFLGIFHIPELSALAWNN